MIHPFSPGDGPEEEAARREAYDRLLAAARRTGTPVARLAAALRALARNETETRRFLTQEVYNVDDDQLDALIRHRLASLEQDGNSGINPES
jgi:hypothetical protein